MGRGKSRPDLHGDLMKWHVAGLVARAVAIAAVAALIVLLVVTGDPLLKECIERVVRHLVVLLGGPLQ